MLLAEGEREGVVADELVRLGVLARLAEGLCATCAHARDCVHRRRGPQRVQCCEEFAPDDDGVAADVAPLDRENGAAGGMLRLASAPREAAPVARSRGLCVDCRHRDACRLPWSETGVWHCGEYE